MQKLGQNENTDQKSPDDQRVEIHGETYAKQCPKGSCTVGGKMVRFQDTKAKSENQEKLQDSWDL